jgi:nitroimidazol reductase NimA-like FMN-containing flavoprotein (pyridoxamine 5'-phosphate oxidase superfamily)
MSAESSPTAVRRHPERGVYERAVVYAILDEAIYCHVGFVHDHRPFVIPTIHARVDDVLYVHGSPASRMLRELRAGIDVCVTVTLLDGLVLARSLYNHSLNYRSVVVLGRARTVGAEEKARALAAIVDHVVPGRARDARAATDKELAGTSVLAVRISEASAKVRAGPPGDFEADLALPTWAGVVPLRTVAGEPVTDERVPVGVETPPYASGYRRPAEARRANDVGSDA